MPPGLQEGDSEDLNTMYKGKSGGKGMQPGKGGGKEWSNWNPWYGHAGKKGGGKGHMGWNQGGGKGYGGKGRDAGVKGKGKGKTCHLCGEERHIQSQCRKKDAT